MKTLSTARDEIFRITDAAGVPRSIAEWRLQNEIDIVRDRGVVDNDDGSISIPSDGEIATMMTGWGEAIANTYLEQLMPSPQHDEGASVIKNTWIEPGDRVDRERPVAYPGPFDPRMPLQRAIRYVFQFVDAYYACSAIGQDHVPRAYTADWVDHLIRAGRMQGLSDIAIVKSLGERVQAIADGYALLIWDEMAA